jgi:hypothetical protein
VLVEQCQDGRLPRAGVAHRREGHGVSADFTEHGDVAGQHGGSAGQCFDERQAEPFPLRRKQHNRAAAIERGQRRAIDERQDTDAACDAELFGESLLVGCERPAYSQQRRGRHAMHDAGKDREQRVDPLPADRASDVKQLGAVGRAKERPQPIVGRGIRSRRARGMHAVFDDAHAVGRNQAVSQQFGPGGRAHADHVRRRLHAAKETPHEHTRQVRFTRAVLDERTERIDVMTRDDRLSIRKRGRQVAVAVVDDMVGVPAAVERPEPARVGPVPMGNPIDGQRDCAIPARHEGADARDECGAQQRRRDVRRASRGELGHQHVGHQVHARPSLLQEVGDERHLERSCSHRSGAVTKLESAASSRTVSRTRSIRGASRS